MGSGDLTATNYGVYDITLSGAALKAQIDAINLAAATDFLYLLSTGQGQVQVLKVAREA